MTMAPTPDPPNVPERSEERKHGRATPLCPAVWMTGVLVWATVIALFLRVPVWGSVFLCVLTGISFLFYLVSYIYLMATDREALRAERYRERSRKGPTGVAEGGSISLRAEQAQPLYLNPESSRSVGVASERAAQPVGGGAGAHKADG